MALKTMPTDAQAHALDRKILNFISQSGQSEAAFDQLALELFAYQYAANEPYRSLCDRLGRNPQTVRTWTHIPAVSAASFADARLACFPPKRTRLRFLSSGTTRSGGQSSAHELENTALYDASLAAHFRRCVIPDRQTMTMLMLSPRADQAPHSSLAYMLSRIFDLYASSGGFFIQNDELNATAISSALLELREPALVFGTALAFVHFLAACQANGWQFTLPAGSRLVETGGLKGQSRSIERDELYAALSRVFGIPEEWCISEYGMCELASQWYDANLSDVLGEKRPRFRLKLGPHWARTLVVDPVSGEPVGPGVIGLLQVFDLANRGSVAAVLTGDLVQSEGEGFIYIGRSQSAPPKGCSITIDSMLRAHA
jgi:Acyl-protein synthetase, LuxE